MSLPSLGDIDWVDLVGLLVVVAYAIAGLLKGAIRFIVGLATVVVGIILAGTFGESLGARDWPFISDADESHRIGVLVGCGLVFAATLLVGALVAKLLRAAAEETDLGGVDRVLGLVFGVLRGTVYVTLGVTVLMFVNQLFPDMTSLRESLEGSRSLEVTRVVADTCGGWFPAPMAEWIDQALQPLPEPVPPPR